MKVLVMAMEELDYHKPKNGKLSWGMILRPDRVWRRGEPQEVSVAPTVQTVPAVPAGNEVATVQPGNEVAQSAIENLGMLHEGFSMRRESVLSSMRYLRGFTDEVDDLLTEFGGIARDHEEQAKALNEREILIAQQNERIAALVADLKAAKAADEASSTALRAKSAAFLKLEERVQEQADQIRELQDNWNGADAAIKAKDVETSLAIAERQKLAHENESARAQIAALNAEVCELQVLVSKTKDDLAFQLEQSERLSASMEEQANHIAEISLENLKVKSERDRLQHTTAELEEKVAALTVDLQAQHAQHLSDRVQSDSQIQALNARCEGLAGKVSLTENMLEAAYEKTRSSMAQIKDFEEVQRRLQSALAALDTLCSQVDEKTKLGLEAEGVRTQLIAKVASLTSEKDGLRSSLEQATAQIDSLQAVITDIRQEHQITVDRLNGRVAELEEALASERTERSFTDGALQVARKDRAQFQDLLARQRRTEAAIPFQIISGI